MKMTCDFLISTLGIPFFLFSKNSGNDGLWTYVQVYKNV